jgi:uncharacterized membrane protein
VERVKSFVRTTLIGGVIVLLPIGILVIVFRWIFGLVRSAIQPLTNMVMDRSDMRELVAALIVIGILIGACFLIGLLVRTQFGKFIHEVFEQRILRIAPGYSLIRETVMQFLGNRPSPFGTVAYVQLFGSDTLALGFVTERHDNGWISIFVPTGPNPTSGNIFHVRGEFIHEVKHPLEDVMRTIISCGAGSAPIMAKLDIHKIAPPPKLPDRS